MATYFVEWQIELDADSPRHAAEQAFAIQRDPESSATVFRIADPSQPEGWLSIDLSEDPADAA